MTAYRFVDNLPDLIEPDDYPAHHDARLVRLRISVTDQGVEILGDAFRPAALERLLGAITEEDVEQMLCG